jgi:hypothetical protein
MSINRDHKSDARYKILKVGEEDLVIPKADSKSPQLTSFISLGGAAVDSNAESVSVARATVANTGSLGQR